MSHGVVLVISRTGDYSEIEKMLEPYDEQSEEYSEEHENEDGEIYNYNPDARWDWWVIGGRWAGDLKPIKNAVGKRGEGSWTFDGKDPYKKGGYDSLQVKDIDPEYLKKLCTFSVLNENGWHEKSKLGWFGCAHPNGYCCIASELTMREVLENFKWDYFGITKWKGWNNKYVSDFIKALHEYYYKDGKTFILKEKYATNEEPIRDDIDNFEFFRNKHWEKNFYNRFLKELNPEMWLTIVDYHI